MIHKAQKENSELFSTCCKWNLKDSILKFNLTWIDL